MTSSYSSCSSVQSRRYFLKATSWTFRVNIISVCNTFHFPKMFSSQDALCVERSCRDLYFCLQPVVISLYSQAAHSEVISVQVCQKIQEERCVRNWKSWGKEMRVARCSCTINGWGLELCSQTMLYTVYETSLAKTRSTFVHVWCSSMKKQYRCGLTTVPLVFWLNVGLLCVWMWVWCSAGLWKAEQTLVCSPTVSKTCLSSLIILSEKQRQYKSLFCFSCS